MRHFFLVFGLCCFLLFQVGCFGLGANFFNQTPGGNLERPTLLNAQTAVTKDGRYALTLQTTETKGCDISGSSGKKLTTTLRWNLFVLDLREGSKKSIEFQRTIETEYCTSHRVTLEVLLHPDNQSFFLLERADGIPPRLRRFHFSDLRETFRAELDTSAPRTSFERSWKAWPTSGNFPLLSLSLRSPSFFLSSSGRFLALQGLDRKLILLDFDKKHTLTLGFDDLMLTDLTFDPKERALFFFGTREYEIVTDPKTGKKEPASGLAIFRLDLTDRSETRIDIPEAAHGMLNLTPSLTIAPEGDLLLVSACKILVPKTGSCSATLSFIDSRTMKMTSQIDAAGPASFSSDGSTVVAWDGKRNELGQIFISFDPTPDDAVYHRLLLIDRDTQETKATPLDMANPTYFLTAKNSLAVTTSIFGGSVILLTDLRTGTSIPIRGQTSMKNFSLAPDGALIYIVEGGELHVLDLKRATFSPLPTPVSPSPRVPSADWLTQVLDHVIAMPSASPRTTAPSAQAPAQTPAQALPSIRPRSPSLETPFLQALRSQLTRPHQTVTLPWKRGSLQDRDDLLLLVSGKRTRFSLWDVSKTDLQVDLYLPSPR